MNAEMCISVEFLLISKCTSWGTGLSQTRTSLLMNFEAYLENKRIESTLNKRTISVAFIYNISSYFKRMPNSRAPCFMHRNLMIGSLTPKTFTCTFPLFFLLLLQGPLKWYRHLLLALRPCSRQ